MAMTKNVVPSNTEVGLAVFCMTAGSVEELNRMLSVANETQNPAQSLRKYGFPLLSSVPLTLKGLGDCVKDGPMRLKVAQQVYRSTHRVRVEKKKYRRCCSCGYVGTAVDFEPVEDVPASIGSRGREEDTVDGAGGTVPGIFL
jgi:hypothetical protein